MYCCWFSCPRSVLILTTSMKMTEQIFLLCITVFWQFIYLVRACPQHRCSQSVGGFTVSSHQGNVCTVDLLSPCWTCWHCWSYSSGLEISSVLDQSDASSWTIQSIYRQYSLLVGNLLDLFLGICFFFNLQLFVTVGDHGNPIDHPSICLYGEYSVKNISFVLPWSELSNFMDKGTNM